VINANRQDRPRARVTSGLTRWTEGADDDRTALPRRMRSGRLPWRAGAEIFLFALWCCADGRQIASRQEPTLDNR